MQSLELRARRGVEFTSGRCPQILAGRKPAPRLVGGPRSDAWVRLGSLDRGMALNFSRVGTAREELEIWSASEHGFSFVISNESTSGPGLHGRPGFVASWRPIHINKPAIRVSGSPFKTLAEAERACEITLGYLTS